MRQSSITETIKFLKKHDGLHNITINIYNLNLSIKKFQTEQHD